ncbi:TMEM175 family protein [Antricoccus suffuscus]|nr:TMEM175 family protein [Antricoccus suffuscus]
MQRPDESGDAGPMPDPDTTSRSPARTIALTDGVAAIAMTLLVLPLIDLVPEASKLGFGSMFVDNVGPFFAFALSFFVIYQFWTTHDRLYSAFPNHNARGVTGLHGIWLLSIAFLPFPTALLGRTDNGGAVPLYLGTLLVISLSGALIALGVMRRYEIESGQASQIVTAIQMRSTWLTTAVFALCFAVSWWLADAALYGLLLLIPARLLIRRAPARTS